ncbi:carboxypeptidase-like regulatory domain-containing protein [Flagellimonas sp. S174]|uniref:carboxypeptidase-like regulatory domain-containing protein n=1 Tax=Flagellimonas sp. S174 TaxID=3410790 RepID=UPI003BF50BD1
MRLALFLMVFCFNAKNFGQQNVIISGRIVHERTLNPISEGAVLLEGSSKTTFSNQQGIFELSTSVQGEHILAITALGYYSKRIPITIEGDVNLGDIYLEYDITSDKEDNLISLTDGELTSEEVFSVSSGLLQSTKDVFLRRAAFDFGQVFFRVRGYDSRNGVLMLNGVPMNKPDNGRPQWNNWGGLNDVTRNQEFTNGLTLNANTFGGILGNTNINLKPSELREGIRISSSLTNRTYRGRIMATYNSGLQKNGLAYSLSGSRRWSQEGYVQGTLYDAYSFFGAVEYHLNENNSVTLATILAKNRRGRSSAVTEEVFNLMGNTYNPYWGNQNGEIRNSRQSNIFEPIVLFNYQWNTQKTKTNFGVVYQFGTNARSRLGFYNATNPDPTYYRYLPSYYLNGPLGADFMNADLAREGFLGNPQMNWDGLYQANTNETNEGKAAYVLYDDVIEESSISAAGSFNYEISDLIALSTGGHFKTSQNQNFARIEDLLGAQFHEDIDTFSNTLNDVLGNQDKVEGDRFNYNYETKTSEMGAFAQLSLTTKKATGFLSASYKTSKFGRVGLFQNERFSESSLGESPEVLFSTTSLKGGATYFISGRHWITINGGLIQRPPVLQNLFINPREKNDIVPNASAEDLATLEVNYFGRLSDLSLRLTAFYTRFMNTTDVNFFFVDSGFGSDFVQEVITGLDRLHKGIELGLEYEVSTAVKLSLVGNLGDYRFASDPFVQINFDTAGAEEDLIDPGGNIDLGISNIKNLRVAQGPQTALSLGVEYRDPKYWWLGATTNHLGNNYINISSITRTASFILDPETGNPFPEATEANVAQLLRQEKLEDVYLLNLVGGKSWLHKGKYISVFASVNNLFDTVFRTGGYEQSRNGNYGQLRQDTLSGSPSFGPKYWYGFGRTYFLNLAVNF